MSELHHTSKGTPFLYFSVATNYGKTVSFVNCITRNAIADYIDHYIGIGSLIGIEGFIESYYHQSRNHNILKVAYLKVFIYKQQENQVLEKEMSDSIQVIIVDKEDEFLLEF